MKTKTLLAALLLCSSCSPYSVPTLEKPVVETPAAWSKHAPQTEAAPVTGRWWKEFGSKDLNDLIDQALENNFTLKTAWARLQGAEALASAAAGGLYPQVNLRGDISRSKLETGTPPPPPAGYTTDLVVGSGLSFELDLWRRIRSQTQAAELRSEAARADLENTALLLSGAVTEACLRAMEQNALLTLLEQQIQTSSTLLELTEVRFSSGLGSALEVLQQRQQLAAIRAEVPAAQAARAQVLNQIATLSGRPAGSLPAETCAQGLPDLPRFPALAAPLDLLKNRPDLRAALQAAQAAEYDVAAAVAERLPRLTLGLSYDFKTNSLQDLFPTELGRIAGGITGPLFDGGTRRAAQAGREAQAAEALQRWSGLFLTALEDVENALAAEYYQKELLERLREEAQFSAAALQESKARYLNGLSDYLPVTLALQQQQRVERRLISEQRALLVQRSRLYRALGGDWMRELSAAPEPSPPADENRAGADLTKSGDSDD